MALSKRMKKISETVDPDKLYPIEEALGLIKELSSVKFND